MTGGSMRNALTFSLLALALVACSKAPKAATGPTTISSSKPEPVGPFGPAAEGEGCSVGSDCQKGLFCLPILPAEGDTAFSGYRCVSGCTADAHCKDRVCFQSRSPAKDAPCSSNEACAAQPDPSYCAFPQNEDVGTCQPYGFCGTSRVQGESCSTQNLAFCSAGTPGHPLVCYRGEFSDGQCMVRCDPTSTSSPCAEGEVCASIFTDPTFGICVSPDPTGVCDLKTRFCGDGELCISNPSQSDSRCFNVCDPSRLSCGAGTSCIMPLSDSRSVCARIAATSDVCDPEHFLFCATGDLCVDESAASLGTNCRRECSPDMPLTCPDGTTCQKLVAGGWACLPYKGQ